MKEGKGERGGEGRRGRGGGEEEREEGRAGERDHKLKQSEMKDRITLEYI